MNYLIIADNPKTRKSEKVARAATLDDALLLAPAIAASGRDVQVWFTHRGRIQYCPLYLTADGYRTAERLADALGKAAASAKKWKAEQKLKKDIKRFTEDENALISAAHAWQSLADSPFKRALFAGRFDEARAALREMVAALEEQKLQEVTA